MVAFGVRLGRGIPGGRGVVGLSDARSVAICSLGTAATGSSGVVGVESLGVVGVESLGVVGVELLGVVGVELSVVSGVDVSGFGSSGASSFGFFGSEDGIGFVGAGTLSSGSEVGASEAAEKPSRRRFSSSPILEMRKIQVHVLKKLTVRRLKPLSKSTLHGSTAIP